MRLSIKFDKVDIDYFVGIFRENNEIRFITMSNKCPSIQYEYEEDAIKDMKEVFLPLMNYTFNKMVEVNNLKMNVAITTDEDYRCIMRTEMIGSIDIEKDVLINIKNLGDKMKLSSDDISYSFPIHHDSNLYFQLKLKIDNPIKIKEVFEFNNKHFYNRS